MAKSKKDDILSAIEEMSVTDLVELISAIEEKFGVTAAAAVAATPVAAGSGEDATEAAEEKDNFDTIRNLYQADAGFIAKKDDIKTKLEEHNG